MPRSYETIAAERETVRLEWLATSGRLWRKRRRLERRYWALDTEARAAYRPGVDAPLP